jgi:DNA-binding transcriptional LysR family regulator
MDQKQLERFVDVVESGSLSRTSRRLNTSQPALSKSLRLLEEQLGVRLLERGPRGVRLTKFGDAFYRRACSITSELRRARDDIEDMKGSTAGTVSLGVTPGPGILDQVIPQAVARVARKRPGQRFRVRSGTLSELLSELHRGDLDLLFTVLDERTEGADLKTRLVFEDHFVLVVGKRHPLLALETITLNDLANFRWALLEDAMPLWHVITELAQRDRIPIQGSPIESNSVVFVRTTSARTTSWAFCRAMRPRSGPRRAISDASRWSGFPSTACCLGSSGPWASSTRPRSSSREEAMRCFAASRPFATS